MDLLDELESKIIPCDGAMGTLLIDSGFPLDQCLEELCVSEPELVRGVHEKYIAAGARVIGTNSFGGNAVRLERHGLEHRVNELNWSAAQLARQCARGRNVNVAGSVGPLGITADEATARRIDRDAVFREQIGSLLDGGVNLIRFETFTDFDELALALYVKQSLHHCPAICSFACSEEGLLPSGMRLVDAFAKLRALDAEIVGVNCVDGRALTKLFGDLPSDGLLSAFPNAGNPRLLGERFVYDMTPEVFADCARSLAESGARLIGGCCGTGPKHIESMVEALQTLQPPAR